MFRLNGLVRFSLRNNSLLSISCFDVFVMKEPLFMLPSLLPNFCRNHVHFDVSMEVSVPNVPRCIYYAWNKKSVKISAMGRTKVLRLDMVLKFPNALGVCLPMKIFGREFLASITIRVVFLYSYGHSCHCHCYQDKNIGLLIRTMARISFRPKRRHWRRNCFNFKHNNISTSNNISARVRSYFC